MNVRDILRGKQTGEVITIRPSDDVASAVASLMGHGIGGLPVVDADARPIGFLSERNIVRALAQGCKRVQTLRVEEIMDRPAPTCAADAPVEDVMARMTYKRLRHLVVIDEGRIVGILSVGDLVKQRIRELETEAGVLRDVLAGQRMRK